MSLHTTEIQFTGSQGSALAASLDEPDQGAHAFALFAHCFTCNKDVFAASRISRELTSSGIAVLRFDFTGLGASDGDFSTTTFSSNVTDLVMAADHLRQRYSAPRVLIGHSLGGAAVLAATHLIPEARAVATIGAPADPEHVLHLLSGSQDAINEAGAAEVTIGRRSFLIRKEFLEDIAQQPQAERISSLRTALMVMHSPTDDVVGIDNARRIFDLARHPKSFISLDGADHLITRHRDARYAATVLGAWAARYAFDQQTARPGHDHERHHQRVAT